MESGEQGVGVEGEARGDKALRTSQFPRKQYGSKRKISKELSILGEDPPEEIGSLVQLSSKPNNEVEVTQTQEQ